MPCKYKMFTELIEIIFNKFYENKVFKCHQMITNRSSKLKNLQRLGGGHPQTLPQLGRFAPRRGRESGRNVPFGHLNMS